MLNICMPNIGDVCNCAVVLRISWSLCMVYPVQFEQVKQPRTSTSLSMVDGCVLKILMRFVSSSITHFVCMVVSMTSWSLVSIHQNMIAGKCVVSSFVHRNLHGP